MEMRKIEVNGVDVLVFENGEIFVKPSIYEGGGGTNVGNGYKYTKINKSSISVHRIVARAFHGEPLDGQEVNHVDGVKKNNCATNLEWTTHAENMAHASQNSLMGRADRWNELDNDQPRIIRGAGIDKMAWVQFSADNDNPKPRNKASAFRNMLWEQAKEYFSIDSDLLATASGNVTYSKLG